MLNLKSYSCIVIKYVPSDPCLSLLNCLSNGSVEKIPSTTYSKDFFEASICLFWLLYYICFILLSLKQVFWGHLT